MKNLHQIAVNMPEEVKWAILWFQTLWTGKDTGTITWSPEKPNQFYYSWADNIGNIVDKNSLYTFSSISRRHYPLDVFDITKVKII